MRVALACVAVLAVGLCTAAAFEYSSEEDRHVYDSGVLGAARAAALGYTMDAEPVAASTTVDLMFALRTNNADLLERALLKASTPSSPYAAAPPRTRFV